jgi:glucose-1-phosphate cytidylyltransferase
VKTLILCGGKGTRAYPHTAQVPKPLLEVGGRPVLAHVMEIYAAQGFCDFVLAAGHKSELISQFAGDLPSEWRVSVVDTGEDTGTAGRVYRVRDQLGPTFLLTYGDGLADVDLAALLAFHRSHDGVATVTTVALPSPYGTVEADGSGRVERFREKPVLADHRINGGFLVMDQEALGGTPHDDLERGLLPALGAAGKLYARPHDGFWRSLDTYKDALELSSACGEKGGPWLRSPTAAPS